MKIAIVTDTHDNSATTKKAVDWIKKNKIKTIIHCGDVFKPEIIKEISKNFKGKIYTVISPADASFSKVPFDSFKKIPRVKIYEEFGELKIGGNPEGKQASYGARKIAFCHFPEIAKELVRRQKYDIVFYGHTHKPWLKKIGKTRLVNPGNIAGMFYKSTFATYDTKTDKLELKIIEQINGFNKN